MTDKAPPPDEGAEMKAEDKTGGAADEGEVPEIEEHAMEGDDEGDDFDMEDFDEESLGSEEGETDEGEGVLEDKKYLHEEYGELEGEEEEDEEEGEERVEEELEEEVLAEEPPVDPSAPYDFSDSKEALKAPFALRPDQLAEVENLWALYQDYTPAYTDLNGYVTEKELVYLLKCLNLMTYTPEQLQELIDFCVRPPSPEGHIKFDHFVWMVTIRQRDMPIEEELRMALEVMDPEKTGIIDREYLREVLAKQGLKMQQKQVDNFIKEVDMSNDGTIGIEDVVGTLCIDLNRDDIIMLLNQINPKQEMDENIDNLV